MRRKSHRRASEVAHGAPYMYNICVQYYVYNKGTSQLHVFCPRWRISTYTCVPSGSTQDELVHGVHYTVPPTKYTSCMRRRVFI